MITLLLQLVIAAVILGFIIWLVQMIPGMDPQIATILRVVFIVIFIVFVIYVLMGLMGGGHLPEVK